MKRIVKGKEPQSLLEHRLKQHADYDNYNRGNGEIYSGDEAINSELDKVLNLNMQTLVNNRREVLELVIQKLTKERPKGNWTVAMLTQKINEWSNKQED